jgi:hypothetical protein
VFVPGGSLGLASGITRKHLAWLKKLAIANTLAYLSMCELRRNRNKNEPNVIRLFTYVVNDDRNKLVFLPLKSLSSLV